MAKNVHKHIILLLQSAILPNTLKCNSHCLPTFTRHLKHFYFSFYWH